MNSTPNDSQPVFLVALARVLGRSRLGQFVVAVLVAFASGGLAYLIWQLRDFSVLMLTMCVLIYGVEKAVEFLPIPVGMRQAWARRKELYNVMVFGCCLLVAYCLPGTSWPGWRYLAISFLGAAFASITVFSARIDNLDRPKKGSNS